MPNPIQKKFNAYIGCPTYIDTKTGFLIIDSKAKVLKIIHGNTGVGMFIGVIQGNLLGVSYSQGRLDALYKSKFTKII